MVETFVFLYCKAYKIKTAKLFYCNRFNVTILSCTNIKYEIFKFLRKFAPT